MDRLLLSGLTLLSLSSTAAAANTWYVDATAMAPGQGTQGAAQTRVHGLIAVVNGQVLEGLTLTDGGTVFDCDVRECVIQGSGLFISDVQQISHCVFWGCSCAVGEFGFSGGGTN